jgi:hypothetical protein
VQSSKGRLYFFQGRLAPMSRSLLPFANHIGPLEDWLHVNDSSNIPIVQLINTSSTTATNGIENDYGMYDGQSTIPSYVPIPPPLPVEQPNETSNDNDGNSSNNGVGAIIPQLPRLFFARLKQTTRPSLQPDPSTTIPFTIIDDDDSDIEEESMSMVGVASSENIQALKEHPAGTTAGELGVSPLWSAYAASTGVNSPFNDVSSSSSTSDACDNIDYDRLCPNDYRADAIVWRSGGGTPVWSVAIATIKDQQRSFEWVYTQLVIQLDKDQVTFLLIINPNIV